MLYKKALKVECWKYRRKKMSIRENPALMREVIEKMGYMVRVMDENHKVIYMNEKMREKYGDTMGRMCYELLGMKNRCKHCVATEAKETGEADVKDILIDGRYYKVISSPADVGNGQIYSIELLHDITEEKQIENDLMAHYGKLKADIEFAKNVQRKALPPDGLYGGMLEVSSLYLPSEELGGDLYDVVKMAEGKTLMYMSDVSGHGVTSSLLTIFLRQMVRSKAEDVKIDLKNILNILLKSYNELEIDKEQYLTILFCIYDREKREATFLNAGHNCFPLIIRADGKVEKIEINGLPVCKLTKRANHMQVTVPMEIGDRIVFYTDGIIEAVNPEGKAVGHETVKKIIKSNRSMNGKKKKKKVISEVSDFTKVAPKDDMAIMVAKTV